MTVIDYRSRVLASRLQAVDDVREVDALAPFGEDLLLDLGDNLATSSWIDGFLVPVIQARASANVHIVAASDVTRAHIVRVLSSRGLRVPVARTRADAEGGRFEILPAA